MTDGDTRLIPSTDELEGAIRGFSEVLEDLQAGHAKLAERAERVEAELCRTNVELAAKVAELNAVKLHLEAILSSLPTGVIVRNAEGEVLRVNEAALGILGCTAEELLGAQAWPGLQGDEANGEAHEFVRPDGRRLVLSNRYSPVRLEEDGTVGSVEILDDRTALEDMTRRVHQLDKMAALGTMTGGIAHEVRNPLNAVRGFAALLAEHMPEGSKDALWARRIQEGVDECNAIVASMLTFADPEQFRPETIDARELIEDTLAAVQRDLEAQGVAERYSITTEVEDFSFPGDRIKLRQALRNLVANAVDAQPEGGEVHIEIGSENGVARLRVTDAGPGISEDIAHRVTDPFFTTHADGTGLGLALVHTIARLHGGSLDFAPTAAPQGGADVCLSIPTSNRPRTR